jgi:hypothetical protein
MHQITDWLAHSARDTRTHNGNRVWKSIRPPDCKMSVRCAAMAEFSTATAYRIECARLLARRVISNTRFQSRLNKCSGQTSVAKALVISLSR